MAEPIVSSAFDTTDFKEQTFIKGGSIVLNEKGYEIQLSGCDSAAKILGWVVHLSEKAWVTREIIRSFVVKASNHHGIKVLDPSHK
jgi:hypothetical protein